MLSASVSLVGRLSKGKGIPMNIKMMNCRAALEILVLTGVFSGVIPQLVLAQSPDDIRAVMRVEIEGESPMDMEYSLGQDRMRLDMPQEVSVISTTGASPSMVMVQHAEQRYIEWSPQQLEMMRQMLQRVPGAGGAEPDIFDPTTMEFEETGQTAQIGNWNAFEVLMHGADGQEGTLWLSTEAEVGLFELSLRAAEAASMLQNPMTGGGAGSQQFLQYRSLAEAQGLPDGRVVRIVSSPDDAGGTVTLMGTETGPLPDGTFAPPAGYEPMQMPSIPGFPD